MKLTRASVLVLLALTLVFGALFGWHAWTSHEYWSFQSAVLAKISSRIWLLQGLALAGVTVLFWLAVAVKSSEARATLLFLTAVSVVVSQGFLLVDHGSVNVLNAPWYANAKAEFTSRANRIFGQDSQIHLIDAPVRKLAAAGTCSGIELELFDLASRDESGESNSELYSKIGSMGLIYRAKELCENYHFKLQLVSSFQRSPLYRSVSVDLNKAFP